MIIAYVYNIVHLNTYTERRFSMARTTITIPDELHAQLEKHKHKLNVSGICQQALRRSLAFEEQKDRMIGVDLVDLDKAVERLRGEREDVEGTAKKDGFEDGYIAAMKISYETLVKFREDPKSFFAPDPEKLFDLFEKDNLPAFEDIHESEYVAKVYYAAWVEGFREGLQKLDEQL
jgi:hypothetical protein